MIILALLALWVIIAAVSSDQPSPGGLCTRCGGIGYTQTTGYAGRTEHCFSPNGRHL